MSGVPNWDDFVSMEESSLEEGKYAVHVWMADGTNRCVGGALTREVADHIVDSIGEAINSYRVVS